jgi:hypothetical protein
VLLLLLLLLHGSSSTTTARAAVQCGNISNSNTAYMHSNSNSQLFGLRPGLYMGGRTALQPPH